MKETEMDKLHCSTKMKMVHWILLIERDWLLDSSGCHGNKKTPRVSTCILSPAATNGLLAAMDHLLALLTFGNIHHVNQTYPAVSLHTFPYSHWEQWAGMWSLNVLISSGQLPEWLLSQWNMEHHPDKTEGHRELQQVQLDAMRSSEVNCNQH